MRPLLALAAATLALLAFTRADTPLVTVHADCDNGHLGAHHVSPDSVSVAQDGDLDWELDDASTATDINVGPKHPGHWPYANDEHFKGGKGKDHEAKADGKHMKKNAAGAYPYNIALTCPGGATVTIDPTIVVH